ncbi:MAG: efflux RND transporter periplasmic adaptor subunit, partial [Gammaproteobacteria bacterium]|nr:efflux RND transporter periplasmic adaptor subunit [Gammaproteobacteria bacterium]
SAQINHDQTRVRLTWGDDSSRLVAERFASAGEYITAGTALLRLVQLNPIIAVAHVAEQEYQPLKLQQTVTLTTTALPQHLFQGVISHIAPVFRHSSRQARIEVRLDNQDELLKPGLFATLNIRLEHRPEALRLPEVAISERDGKRGVFVVSSDRNSVTWQTITTGIDEPPWSELLHPDLSGRQVVTLGQQLLQDGSAISLKSSD